MDRPEIASAAWLEIILAATDLVSWTNLIGFAADRHATLFLQAAVKATT